VGELNYVLPTLYLEKTEEIIGSYLGTATQYVPDNRVSRTHCTVGIEGTEVFVTDNGSKNGTWIGDSPEESPESARLVLPQQRCVLHHKNTLFICKPTDPTHPTVVYQFQQGEETRTGDGYSDSDEEDNII
jgi:hypothetical protein